MNSNYKIKSANKFFVFTMLYMLVAPFLFSIFYMIFSNFININLIFTMILSTLFLMAVPVAIYFLVSKQKFAEVVPIKKVSIKNLIFITLICISIQPVMSFLATFGLIFSESVVTDMAYDLASYPFILSLIAIAIMPAIFEELLMRGVVAKQYEDLPLKQLALVNGLFFGIIHGNLEQFFYAALLGAVFIYFLKLTGSILAPIYAHFIINGSQISIVYLVNDMSSRQNTSVMFMDIIVTFLIAIPFCAITYFLLKKFIKLNQEAYDALPQNRNIKIIDENFARIIILFLIQILINSLTSLIL